MSDHSPERTLSHSSGVIHEIRWSEVCPWLILAKALRVTLLLRVLVLAAIGFMLTNLGWSVISQQFSPALEMPAPLREQLPTLQLAEQSDQVLETVRPALWQSGTFVSGWYWLTAPLLELGSREHSMTAMLGHLLMALWAMVVWALLGGAISRIAAMYLTRGETLGPLQALREAAPVLPATLGSPVIVLLAALALAIPMLLLGLLLRLELLAALVAVVWFLVLAWGFVLAVILIGLLLGWPLMWACLAIERSDAFDGVSRCYAYVYQRPLHFAFFVMVAAGLSVLGDQVVSLFTSVTITLTEWIVNWGIGNERATALFAGELESSSVPIATQLIGWWNWGIETIAKSFPLASLWVMAVGIYLLLRRLVDATEMDEVVLADGKLQPGLPTTKANSAAQQLGDDNTSPATDEQ